MTKIPSELKEFCPSPHNVKMHGSVVVGTKGQIVIPSGVRADLNINPGDHMFVITKHNKLVGLIKMDELDTFLEYMQQEMDAIKTITQAFKK